MALADYIERFSRQRVLVIGDVILDHYVRGDVSRTSVEAPVPILMMEDEEYLPGGAANVAKNLVSLGAQVDLVGLAGQDEAGLILRSLLMESPLLTPHLFEATDRPTILKTRCVAQGQQMLRIDRERVAFAPEETYTEAMKKIRELMENAAGVILSDYGKGFLRPAFIEEVAAEARQRGLKVVVDPKGRDYERYRGVSVLTPNQKEAGEAAGVPISDNESLELAAQKLQETVAGEAIVITRGPYGVSVYPSEGQAEHLPARARSVFDVTGAGDTFIAALGLSLFSGVPLAEAAELGNLAGGFVVGLAGVATVSADDLRDACEDDPSGKKRKLHSASELEQICRSLRQHGSKVVFTNGFFDLLHYGHIRLLEEARGMGDTLIVAINSDESVRHLQGDPRPLLTAEERAAILSALPFVDYVTVFEEDTPEPLLKRLRPDLLVKGAPKKDKAEEQEAVGQDIVEGYGGQVRFVWFEGSTSTRALLARVNDTPKKEG